jgi:hypothetical protein
MPVAVSTAMMASSRRAANDRPWQALSSSDSSPLVKTGTARRTPGSDRGQGKAVELGRLVPSPGSLWIAGQQVWLGPAMTGRTVRLWAGLKQVHLLLGGHRIKTLPSRLDARDLARLTAAGAQPAARRRCPRHRGT